jgi:hypothetical protein
VLHTMRGRVTSLEFDFKKQNSIQAVFYGPLNDSRLLNIFLAGGGSADGIVPSGASCTSV